MTTEPQGEIAIQTLAMPKDTNPAGDIFGGWLVSQMDLSAGLIAKKCAQGRVATVSIQSMSFLRPVHVGDVVTCYAHLQKVGNTSMTIAVEVWAEPATGGQRFQVTSGIFVFVAIDRDGKPRPVSGPA